MNEAVMSEADRRAFVATRTPMTKDDLDAAREVLCTQVEPETTVAYYFTLLVMEVERVQATEEAPGLRAALEATLDAMRALRRLAFTGSRIPVDRYPEKAQADKADEMARAALARARGETP